MLRSVLRYRQLIAVSFNLVHVRVISDRIEVSLDSAHVRHAFDRVKHALQSCHIGEVLDRVEPSFCIPVRHSLIESFQQARWIRHVFSGIQFTIDAHIDPFHWFLHVGKVPDGIK